MKKTLKIFGLFLVLTLIFTACNKGNGGPAENGASGETSSGDKKVIKVSTKFVDDEQTAKSLKLAVDAINERSDGSLELQLFTGGILPIGKDGMEQIVQGSDWILVDGINFLGDYVPDYNAIVGPFLYQTFDEYFSVLDSPIVERLNKEAEEEHGIKVLGLDWVFGFRSMMADKPIITPADMDGLNIRVPTSQLYTYTIEKMGGNPVSMPYPDTYAALQQGVINGVEGSIMTYYGTGQYENVKEYSLTNHLLGVSAITVNNDLWNSLTEEQRTIIEEELAKASKDNLEKTIELEAEYTDLLKGEGVHFHEVDVEAFKEATAPVYTMFDKWTPGIHEEILKVLEENK